MPKYRCIRPFLLQGKDANGVPYPVRTIATGEVVEYDGLPSDNLEPVDKAGEKRREEAEEVFAAQRRKAALNASQQNVGLASAIAEMVAAAVAEAMKPARRAKSDEAA